jgi:hypothetical protein
MSEGYYTFYYARTCAKATYEHWQGLTKVSGKSWGEVLIMQMR